MHRFGSGGVSLSYNNVLDVSTLVFKSLYINSENPVSGTGSAYRRLTFLYTYLIKPDQGKTSKFQIQ